MNDDAMPCRRCGGEGRVASTDSTCGRCKGTGQEPDAKPKCANCGDSGWQYLSLSGEDDVRCSVCNPGQAPPQVKLRTPAEVLELREWPNQGCCESNWADQTCDCLEEAEAKPRTPAEVIRLRTEGAMHGGCCDRFADNKGCDCLTEALRRIGCGVQGQDLECVGCGEKLYGQQVVDVCPYLGR